MWLAALACRPDPDAHPRAESPDPTAPVDTTAPAVDSAASDPTDATGDTGAASHFACSGTLETTKDGAASWPTGYAGMEEVPPYRPLLVRYEYRNGAYDEQVWVYDGDELAQRLYTSGPADPYTYTETYAGGLVVSWTGDEGSDGTAESRGENTYDAAGNPLESLSWYGGGSPDRTVWTYDAGLLTSIRYDYDSDGTLDRLDTVTWQGDLRIHAVDFDPDGVTDQILTWLDTWDAGELVQRVYTYDDDADQVAEVVSTAVYEQGRMVSLVEAFDGGAISTVLTYDGWGRLLTSVYTTPYYGGYVLASTWTYGGICP